MKVKMNRGFVYEELIKWFAIGAIVLLGGWGLFKYQSGLYADIARLEQNEKTLTASVGEKDKEIKFLKELDASNQQIIKDLKEVKGQVDVKTQVIYRDKIKVIDGINNNPNLPPEEKKALKSAAQIDSVWQSFCTVAGIGHPGCYNPTATLKEEKK